MNPEEKEVDSISKKLAGAILVFLIFLGCIPIFLWKFPPLVDYPMHVARAFLLSLPQNGQGITEFFQAKIQPVPNLGMDLIVSQMMHFLPPMVAGKVFLCLMIALILSGGFALATKIHGRPTLASFLPCLALYDQWFMMGFANYLLGIGLALWGVVLWLQSKDWPNSKRITALVIFALAMIVCHLMSFLVAVGIIIALSIKDGKRFSAPAQVGLASVSLCVVAILALTVLKKTPVAWDGRFETWLNLFRFSPSLVPGLVVPAFMFGIGFNRRLLTPIVGLLVFALLGPSFLGGTAFACDRLTLPLTLLCLISIEPKSQNLARIGAICASILFVLGLANAFKVGSEVSNRTESVVKVLKEVPSRSTLATLDLSSKRKRTVDDHRHIADWVLLDQPIFVAQNFAKKLQQPMIFAPDYEEWHKFQNNNPIPVNSWSNAWNEMAKMISIQQNLNSNRLKQGKEPSELYVLVLDEEATTPSGKPDSFTLFKSGKGFYLYKAQ